jgi:tetratricopeptide (TPR) repeat protein
MKRFLPGAALLLLLVAAAYLPALRGGFIWDDEAHVVDNATLRSTDGLKAIWTEPSATPQYYPLVHTTFWLEYRAWGVNPFGYHLTNVLLHAVNACLLYIVLASLGVPGACWGAALFALHPVQVESVAWITERKNVLSTFFYLASALAWVRFAGLGESQPAKRPGLLYAAALALFVAALLSKTVACSLPAALLLVTWWKTGRITQRDVLLMLPFFGVGLLAGFSTAWLEMSHVGASGAEWSLSSVERCLVAGRAVLFYLGKLIWPHPLIFMYPRWTIDARDVVQYVPPLLVVAALLEAWFARRRRGRAPFTVMALYVGTLFPALGFFNVYPMRYSFVADHFQYLACLFPLAAFAACWPKKLAAPVLAVAVAVCAVLTWQRTHAFANAETLWRDALARNPSSWMAHNNLGLVLQNQGRAKEALAEYEAAVALKSDAAEALTSIGVFLAAGGERDRALAYHRRAVASDPRSATAQNNLGMTLAQAGNVDEGIEHLRASLLINPRYANAQANLGHASLLKGDLRTAVSGFRSALQLEPGNVDAANNLAWILATSAEPSLRSPGEAVWLAEFAVSASPGRTPAFLDTLAAAYAAAGRYQDAAKTVREAVRIAEEAGNVGAAGRMKERLKLYEAGKPYVWIQASPTLEPRQ